MQETGSVLQEFARMNELRAPNYSLDMFSQTQPYHGAEEEEGHSEDEDEMEEQDVQRSVDDYEATFEPQYATPKGPIVRSLTQHTTLTDGTSRHEYGLGKGKV